MNITREQFDEKIVKEAMRRFDICATVMETIEEARIQQGTN